MSLQNEEESVSMLTTNKQETHSINISKHTSSLFTVVSNMVAHISALVFPAIIIFYAAPGSSLFSWHPTLMAIGFTLLMVEGIVVFSKDSALFPKMSRPTKASVHYWLMGIAVSAILTALGIIYVHKERSGKSHFTTWHGFFGVLTVGYVCAQSTGGAVLKYHKYLSSYIKVKLVDLKLYHATSGLLAFLLATITLLLALQTTWVEHYIPTLLWYVCMACVSGSALVVTMHITSTYLPQTRQPVQARQ